MYYKYCQRCGRPSNGYPLCKSCYYEQKENEEYNDNEFEYNDECDYNIKTRTPSAEKKFHQKFDRFNKYKCKCGIYVKSLGERTIADFLFNKKIPFEYERTSNYEILDLSTGEIEDKSIYPDFFIKGPIYFKGKWLKNIYIEYWGKSDEKYIQKMQYKLYIFRQHGCTLINLYPNDILDYEENLTYKLTHYEEYEINY